MSEIARRDGAPEVLPSLLELAVIANEEHALCEQILRPALQSALPHAIAAGEALVAARQQLPTGSWRRWLSENFDASFATANRYARIAQYKHLLTDPRSTKDALDQLAGLPDAASRAGTPRLYGEDVRDAALRDRRAGKTIYEVADTYEVSPTTVWRWEHPGQQAAIRRRWYAKRKKKLQAGERAERTRAVRASNAALAEAYAMAERMQDVLAQAQRPRRRAARHAPRWPAPASTTAGCATRSCAPSEPSSGSRDPRRRTDQRRRPAGRAGHHARQPAPAQGRQADLRRVR